MEPACRQWKPSRRWKLKVSSMTQSVPSDHSKLTGVLRLGDCGSRNSPQRRKASLWGFINYGRFLERFTNGKRLIIVNLFIWSSKNRFIIIVLIENRFTNHQRVHVHEPFQTGVKQWHLIGSQNRFIICGLLYKRTIKNQFIKRTIIVNRSSKIGS